MSARDVDPEYTDEWTAAGDVGFARSLVDIEALLAGDADQAVRRVAAVDERVPAIYRGWMLPFDRYAELHAALADRAVDLLTSPDAYRHCHHLPASYADIEANTPRSVWLRKDEGLGIDNVMAQISGFDDAAVIVKDFVKSRKHEWNDACYIRRASDRAEVERVVGNFVRGQGTDLAEELVFREFVPLKRLDVDKRTGAPVNVEYRMFYVNDRRLLHARHFEVDMDVIPPFAKFDGAASSIASPFFSMDVALTEAGDWIIVELGDGQVAGLPEAVNASTSYASSFGSLSNRPIRG